MQIRAVTQGDLPLLYEFNKRMYPERKHPEHLIDFWFSKDFNEINNTVIMLDDAGKIVGQCFYIDLQYYLDGKLNKTVWGFDLIVEETLRKSGVGADLMVYCLEKHPLYAATGVGPSALLMHNKLGRRELGKLRKYVSIRNLFHIINSLFCRTWHSIIFPESITVSEMTFIRKTKDDCFAFPKFYNEKLMEPVRDEEFIKWRFFGGLNEYFFYQEQETNIFFVVRPIMKKHILMLSLVDYRCEANGPSEFRLIVTAFHELANQLRIAVTICGSSLEVFDTVLEETEYRSIGYERPIIGKVKEYSQRQNEINRRDFIFLTLADSDGETSWK